MHKEQRPRSAMDCLCLLSSQPICTLVARHSLPWSSIGGDVGDGLGRWRFERFGANSGESYSSIAIAHP